MRNGFEKVFDHFGWSEAEFFAAHAAQQPAEREEAQARALRLIEQRTKTLADAAVVGKARGERFLRGGACFDSRGRGTHQLGRIGSGFAKRQIEIGESAAFR